jgi:putative MFS transporter
VATLEQPGPRAARFTPYQRLLFVFLSVATFFEGYDFLALTQILPNLRADMGLDKADAGYLVGFINFGTILAYVLVRQADRWGRRRVLTVTIAGYTLLTFLTGFAPNVYAFALLQMLARIFLLSEWAISMVMAAEEFPAARRGMVIGVVSACGSFGSIVCAGVVPLLLKTELGWRSVYFVGILPLLLLAYARRRLRETERFTSDVGQGQARPLLHILRTGHRRRVLELGAIWFLTYVCTQNGVTFWKEFALAERGMTDADVGMSISIAALGSMPMVFFAGKLLDVLGRRRGAVIIFTLAVVGIFCSYTLHGRVPLTIALTFGIFGAGAVLPVLNAYTAELFPTALRGDAFAWSNNLIGRIGYTLSPPLVGVIAERTGWGAAVRVTAIFPIAALVLILWLLPETRAKELDQTAQL